MTKINSVIRKLRNKCGNFLGLRVCSERRRSNIVMYDNTSIIRDTRIVFQGNDNLVKFDKNCKIQGLRVLVLGNYNEIYFKKHVIVNASCNQPTVINCVGGKKLKSGKIVYFQTI